MTALPLDKDPADIPAGATIRRIDPARPYVAMSNRKRWSKCALSAVLPQVRTPSGPSAEEGTEAHKVAEWALETAFGTMTPKPMPVVQPPPGLDGFDYSERGVAEWQGLVARSAYTYSDKAKALFSDCQTPTTCLVEHKIKDVIIAGVRVATVADVVLWNEEAKRLVVGDYKFGRGPVGMGTREAPNEQVAGTLALLAERVPFANVQMAGGFVYQPRTYAGEPWQVLAPLPTVWIDEQFERLTDELRAVAAAAKDRDGTAPVPGDHCKYCPSARWCPAASGFGGAAIDVAAGGKPVIDLTPEEVMAIWSQRPAFKAFMEDLGERVRILAEEQNPAVTVRRRIGNSTWKAPDKVAELLMLNDKAHLLQPPGIAAVKGCGIDVALIEPHITRAPDVLTYLPTAGKQPDVARDAFNKYLPTKE